MIEFVQQSQERYGPPAPVDILQEEAEFVRLLSLYRQRRPWRVLEIGTYKGGTFYHWLNNARRGALVVSVDTDPLNTEMYNSWCAPEVGWRQIVGDSRDKKTLRAAKQHGPYDWVFIDAGHLDGEVRADWKNYRPMAASPSVVAFHDIAHHPGLERVQVHLLWAEIRDVYQTIEYLSDGGSGIGVVFMP